MADLLKPSPWAGIPVEISGPAQKYGWSDREVQHAMQLRNSRYPASPAPAPSAPVDPYQNLANQQGAGYIPSKK